MESCDEYKNYWETKHFLENEEYSWAMDEFSGYYDSSSPDGPASPAASKNIVFERNRRRKLNERLFALKAVVPYISKLKERKRKQDGCGDDEHWRDEAPEATEMELIVCLV